MALRGRVNKNVSIDSQSKIEQAGKALELLLPASQLHAVFCCNALACFSHLE